VVKAELAGLQRAALKGKDTGAAEGLRFPALLMIIVPSVSTLKV